MRTAHVKARAAVGHLATLALALILASGCAGARPADPAPGARFTFPPEWAPHEAVWMGWSPSPERRPVQIEMIRALAPHVTVRLMVTSDRRKAEASEALAAAGVDLRSVEFFDHPISNFWMRDPGPHFISDGRRLAIADFGWNAYGYPGELLIGSFNLQRHAVVLKLAARLKLPVVATPVVAEGGGLDASDEAILSYKGTALQRNPGVPIEEIEREYLRVYGKRKMVWLDQSPLADRMFSGPKIANYFGDGANGHIDEYARFVDNQTIVIAQIDPADADNPLSRADLEILRANLAQLRAATNVDGQPFRVVTLPVPALRHHVRTGPLREEEKKRDFLGAVYRDFNVGDEVHWVPATSYLNFVISNGVVLVARYWREGLPEREREKDEYVRRTLQGLFPARRVVQIDPMAINATGGGMHCTTLQQPRVGGR